MNSALCEKVVSFLPNYLCNQIHIRIEQGKKYRILDRGWGGGGGGGGIGGEGGGGGGGGLSTVTVKY